MTENKSEEIKPNQNFEESKLGDGFGGGSWTNQSQGEQPQGIKHPSDLGSEIISEMKQSGELKIRVCDPVIKEETLKKYVLYTIKGHDNEGTFECFRRYSEFKALRDVLTLRWPGIFIPPIPSKKATGNLDPKFIEDRRKFLQQFLQELSKLPYLYQSEELQKFLRTKMQDIEKALSVFGPLKAEALVTRLKKVFGHLIDKPLDSQVLHKITAFHAYLTKVKGMFESFENQTSALVQAKKSFYTQINQFQSQLMLHYEQNCLAEYTTPHEDDMIFTGKSKDALDSIVSKIKKDSSCFTYELLYDMIRIENREIEAFLELIKKREEIDVQKAKLQIKVREKTDELERLRLGKTSMKSLFTRKTKEEETDQIKNALELDKKDLEATEKLRNIISAIMAYQEIDRFKAAKTNKYYEIVKECALMEIQAVKDVESYWYSVLESPKIK